MAHITEGKATATETGMSVAEPQKTPTIIRNLG